MYAQASKLLELITGGAWVRISMSAEGLLTATQKLVRHKIAKAYAARIQSLFTPQGMNPRNDDNREALQKLFPTA